MKTIIYKTGDSGKPAISECEKICEVDGLYDLNQNAKVWTLSDAGIFRDSFVVAFKDKISSAGILREVFIKIE